MRWPVPSLVRRLTFAFVLGHGLAMLLLLFAIYPLALSEDDEPVGPDVVHAHVARELIRAPDGRLAVRSGGNLSELARKHPRAWFVASVGRHELSFGPVPNGVREQLARLPSGVRDARIRGLGDPGPAGDVGIDEVETPAGKALVTAGGVDSSSIDYPNYVRLMNYHEFFWMPVLSAALTLLGTFFAIPILLRSIRPSAKAAAELDPADLSKRLPEKGVVKQLLPLIRAFNAALDRVADAFERRRRFIADMAHELRTPVAVLNMHVEAMPDVGSKRHLQRSVYRLGQMIGQMLDAQRLTLTGRERDAVDLVDLSRATVAEIAPLAVANGYDVAVNIEAEPVMVEGDRYAIGRALANLLGNAIAHGGGSGTIEVRVARDGRIDVSDEGPGISEEARARIFEPFRRERWDRDGCGLGLHLVREIMHAHGGTAKLVGSGPGAVFRLQFPLVQPA